MSQHTSPQAFSATLSGHTLRGLRFNQGQPHKALALHGWLDNANSFGALAQALPDTEIIALEFAGHGHSDHLAAGVHYHYVDFVSDVLQVLQTLDWPTYSLIAHSLGAALAPLVALSASESLTQVVLIDGIGPLSEHSDHAASRWQEAMQQRLTKAHRHPRPYPSFEAAKQARARVNQIGELGLTALCQRNLIEREGQWFWRYDQRLKRSSPTYLTESQAQSLLRAVAQPCLLIEATQGYIAGREHTQARFSCLAQAQRVQIEGHHHVHLDQPEACAEAIRAFITH